MIRILRPTGTGTLISGRVFDDSFARNLHPELDVRTVDLTRWLDSIFGNETIRPAEKSVHRAFRSATQGFDFLCPNYVAIPTAPLLVYLRNRSGARIRLLLIAHAPGAYALEWALLRPLLRSGDIIVAPTNSARDVIGFLSPEIAAYVRVVPHPIHPLPQFHASDRPHIVSLTRMHPSKLLHRLIEAAALLRDRGCRGVSVRIAGPIHEPVAQDVAPYARSLLARISRLRLGNCVALVGEIAGDSEKSRFLSEARLLVNLSVSIEESFGKAIVEALATGVPTVATHWDGFPETIGAGGSCVPVDATLLGMEVPAERIADAIKSALDAPPSREACRNEALRFHPRRVRHLYLRELEAIIQAPTSHLVTGEVPSPQDSAAPTSGLLANTAPLAQISWRELFDIHVRDVARMRASRRAFVHPTATEADELRSLLIAGVQAPLSRRLADLSLNGMDQPVGSVHARNGGAGFLGSVADGALSRATLSSRFACLSLIAHRGEIQPLRRVIDAMRADGLRSWGIEHLEIEALRLEGQYERAFEMSISRTDPLYWGELAGDRLRQLAAVCRDWYRPEIALPWLRQWLGHFPDAPDSGPVQLDRCTNAIAAGSALLNEARQAWGAARNLLGESVDLKALENSICRAEALEEELPIRAVEQMVGTIAGVRPIGRSTFMLHAAGGRFVLKQMRHERDPGRYLDVLRALAQMQRRFCPRPLTALHAGHACWYALFEWVDGEPPSSATLDDTCWRSVVDLLRTLASCNIVPEWHLESIWLDRLEQHISDQPAAAFIIDALRRAMPEGERTLAHGDFSPQNFIRASGGIVLVDWEEIGSAPPGFDAGWMLAHARLGAGARSYAEMLRVLAATGFPKSNLHWFERLGLLRLLFRARALPMDDDVRQRILAAVHPAVQECATGMGWLAKPSLAGRGGKAREARWP